MMVRALCIVALLCGMTVAEKVSPVQKVIELLDQLKAKVRADQDAEGAEAQEFAEFCDKEISETGYAITTATREIGDFKASIEDSGSTISAKEAEIGQLGSAISGKEAEGVENENVFKEAQSSFQAAEKELVDTVDELAGGIIQVKKGASLMQVRKNLKPVMTVLSKIVEASSVETKKRRALNAFLQSTEDSDLVLHAPQGNVDIGGGGHSDPIVNTLEDMKSKAEDQLTDARKNFMGKSHDYEMVKMSLAQEIKNLKDTLGQATSLKASSNEAMGKARGELAEVEKSKAANEAYLESTKLSCATRASEWEERKTDADAEVAAIAKAKDILSNGVKAFFQTSIKSKLVDEDDMTSQRRERLVALLKTSGSKLHSFAFMQLAHMAGADPFAKIKGMISTMVEKLLQEANEEASHKSFCDEELAKSRKSKEEKSMKLDKYIARIDSATSSIAELELSIKGVEQEIAEIDAATSDAAKIRQEENAEFLKASSDFKASAEAVQAAIQVLKSYYNGGALIQTAATTTSKSKAKAKAKDANTIISVLEMAEGDFTKLLAEAETGEGSSQSAYNRLVQESRVTKTTKQAEIQGKESEIKSLSVSLENYKEDKQSVSEELDAIMQYLDKLKPECETKAMSYEEKVARRNAEIDGLKEALAIMEGQDIPVLLQAKAQLRGVKRA